MGDILEAIFQLALAAGKNKKNSPWIRYPMLLLAGIIYFGTIAFMIYAGFYILKDGLWGAIIMWGFAFTFVVATIWVLRKDYIKRKNKKRKNKL